MSALKSFVLICFLLAFISVEAKRHSKSNLSASPFRSNNRHSDNIGGLNLAQVRIVQDQIKAKVMNQKYSCPSGFSRMSHGDLVNNNKLVCKQLNLANIAHLKLDNSADGPEYSCHNQVLDARKVASSFCVQSQVTESLIQKGTSCPTGFDVASYNEASSNIDGLCNKMNLNQISLVGISGKLTAGKYGCELNDFSNEDTDSVVCVKRLIQSTQALHETSEVRCGKGYSLVSVEEVLTNVQGYCNLLSAWDSVRLQGGASLDGEGFGCKVRSEDNKILTGNLCAPEI